MRFSCRIFIQNNSIIPNDYRRYLLSLIKEALKKSGSDGEDYFSKFYNKNKQKPFTFSAYFPLKRENGKNLLNGNFFSFYFSTNDFEFLMRVYNGLLAIKNNKNNNFELFGSKIDDIKNFYPAAEKRFYKNEATFKTLSPFLVRSTEDGDKYLYPTNLKIQTNQENKNPDYWKYWQKSDKFVEELNISLKALVQNEFSQDDKEIDIELINCVVVPVLHGSGNSEHPYHMTYPGIKGKIRIKAAPEILKLFYDIGIGARRSEGFGMLEVEG